MVFLYASAISTMDSRGRRFLDDDFLVTFNAAEEDSFVRPRKEWGAACVTEIDTVTVVVCRP